MKKIWTAIGFTTLVMFFSQIGVFSQKIVSTKIDTVFYPSSKSPECILYRAKAIYGQMDTASIVLKSVIFYQYSVKNFCNLLKNNQLG